MKGAATVNGTPGYGFVAYVYDEPDSFRLLVWDLASGPIPSGTLAYDNVEGAGYDLDAANPQPISTGSISRPVPLVEADGSAKHTHEGTALNSMLYEIVQF